MADRHEDIAFRIITGQRASWQLIGGEREPSEFAFHPIELPTFTYGQ